MILAERGTDYMMRVAVATKSFEKIAGVKEAILRYFNMKESEIEFLSTAVKSGVSDQPFGEETYRGASNRLQGAKNIFPEMDYYVSCEAGIESAFGQYFNVQVVCIFETNSEKLLWGKSAGWSIPSEDIERIRKSNLDSYLRGKGISSIEELLGTSHSRRLAVAQATELALASGKLLK